MNGNITGAFNFTRFALLCLRTTGNTCAQFQRGIRVLKAKWQANLGIKTLKKVRGWHSGCT